MIHHVLLVKQRKDLSPEELREFDDSIQSLSTISGVVDITWGQDFSGRAHGYTHGAVMRFENREALDAYAADPVHVHVVDILNRLGPDRLVLDYETGISGISAP